MASSTVAAQAQNLGASVNFISGIQGVNPGGVCSINMPVNQRIHRETFQCSGIMYRNPTATVTGSGGGSGATFTLTLSNGVITGIAIAGGGSGYSGTITGTILDAEYTTVTGQVVRVGQGATFTATQSAGAINSVTLTSGGTVSAIPPELFFTGATRKVNGNVQRDITPAQGLKINAANGIQPADASEYTTFFTEPWRKIVDHDQATAWDLIGQSTYQITLNIATGMTSPNLTGVYEFDYLRNMRVVQDEKGNDVQMLFLRPIQQHAFTFNANAGMYNATTIPIDVPIQRIWFEESVADNIYQIEIYQDGNKVLEGSRAQVNQLLAQYGYDTSIFQTAAVFDMDQRLGKALVVSNNLIVRVFSTAAASLTCVTEQQYNRY
jgi:hypothetical protein